MYAPSVIASCTNNASKKKRTNERKNGRTNKRVSLIHFNSTKNEDKYFSNLIILKLTLNDNRIIFVSTLQFLQSLVCVINYVLLVVVVVVLLLLQQLLLALQIR